MNLARFFARNAGRASGHPAIALGCDVLLDHRQLALRVASLAASFLSGVSRGGRVAVIADNCPHYVEILGACWWAGLTAVPINAKLQRSELTHILDNADVSLVLTDNQHAHLIDSDKPVVVINSPVYRRMLQADSITMAEAHRDDMAWLFYTSGTTGKPKGAMITHGNIQAMAWSYFIDIDQIASNDCIIHAAPMSHGSGLYAIPHLIKGACQVVPESGRFDPHEIGKLWSRHLGSTMFAAPTMVKRLTRHGQANDMDHRGLKTIVYGGAPMYLNDLDEAHDVFGFKFAQLYGQGEAPMTITGLDKAAHADTTHPRYRERLASAGCAQSLVEVRIGDENGLPLPAGGRGEIMARGDVVVPGYWRDPEATEKTMGDGWLRTGDVGVMDEDGFVTLKDRSKDLIISGGANIYPREVEEVLLTHPGIREAAIIGVRDEEWGEAVVACVVSQGQVSENELDQLCIDRIARFKRPKVYHFLDELPKNSYGKILKTALRDQFS